MPPAFALSGLSSGQLVSSAAFRGKKTLVLLVGYGAWALGTTTFGLAVILC